METFWDTLGIHATTDQKKIRKAYSALVKVHNPEDDEEQFRKINSAYKAAMKFASTFTHLDLSDEQIEILDVRPDGSFGVKFYDKKGKPMFPAPPAALPKEEASFEPEPSVSDSDKLFDFDSIDSSVVSEFTQDELNTMSGHITLVPGFPVPDSERTRALRDYLNEELNVVKDLSVSASPDQIDKAIDDAVTIATVFVKNERFRGEKLLWQVYFFSPLVKSLKANLFFYRRLEMLINDEKLTPGNALIISEVVPNRPRVYITKTEKKEDETARIDFISKVPFRYIEGEYQEFDELMNKEDKGEVDKLIKFLETIPVNIYGPLMPSFPPSYKNKLLDAEMIFHLILTAPFCKDMMNNRLLWKLYFRGKLIRPIIHRLDLHTMITKKTMEIKIPKETLKIIKKEMSYSETAFIVKKKEDKEWFYLKILNNDPAPTARTDKEKKLKTLEIFGFTLGIAIGLLILIIKHYLA